MALDTVELAARFNRVLLVLISVHVAMFFFCNTWTGLMVNLATTVFIFLGMLAASRQRSCVLALWGTLTGLYVLFLTFVALAGLPRFVHFTISAVRQAPTPAAVIASICLATLFLVVYYAVTLSAAILAFRLRCAIVCNKMCTKYEPVAVEMGQCEEAPAAVEDTTQFFAVPAVGAPVPYAVPSDFAANFSGQPMYVMVPLAPVTQQ